MNILVIDTSSTVEAVCARVGGRSHGLSEATGLSHSTGLIDRIDRCLDAIGARPRDLELLCVGVGPGSFTGIRIAVSTMRMFAQVLGIPLVGIESPLLFAASAPAGPGVLVCAAQDAKKGRLFGALYRVGPDGSLAEVVPPGDHLPEKLLGALTAGEKAVVVGNGLRARGVSAPPDMESIVEIVEPVPDPEKTCALGEALYLADPGRWADYRKVVPLYARPSDAEAARARD